VYAALVGYSRIPYASAQAGHFFKVFAQTHPTGQFPHRSLLLISAVATVACLADLETVIKALLTSRILVQFVGQIATVFYLRRKRKVPVSGFRMPLYPLPALIALAGWLFAFATSGGPVLAYGLVSLLLGLAAFLAWDFLSASRRPSAPAPADGSLASGPDGE
jgi:amino acid transporter